MVEQVTSGIRSAVAEHLEPHLRAAVGQARGTVDVDIAQATAALLSTRYGRVYWIRPSDARALLPRDADDEAGIDGFAAWLTERSLHVRIFDAAFTDFVSSPRFEVRRVDAHAPHDGVQAVDARTLVVRAPLAERAAAADRPADEPAHDPHDLAHLAAASLDPELYGVKLHDAGCLARLPASLRDQVAGFDAAAEPTFADGAIFSGLLHGLFCSLRLERAEEVEAVEELTSAVVPFLLGRCDLVDHRTGGVVRPNRPILPAELAVNAQNQAYEAPASEIEQLLFVRGAADGRDDLDGLSASGRLRAIAGLTRRTYHERRNIVKRRAQHSAYKAVAQELERDPAAGHTERELARLTRRSLEFADHGDGARTNLFCEVARRLSDRPPAVSQGVAERHLR